jgi:prepilin-type N-terminal cleavage/methylation domain-containing protein
MRATDGSRAEGGMTLIEVIIALSILAVVVLGMGQFAFNFSRTERQSEARTIAVNLADQRLSLIRSSPNYSTIDSIFGVAEPTITGFPSYARSTTIVHTGGPLPTYSTDYKTITVRVTSPALKTAVVKTVVVAAP